MNRYAVSVLVTYMMDAEDTDEAYDIAETKLQFPPLNDNMHVEQIQVVRVHDMAEGDPFEEGQGV